MIVANRKISSCRHMNKAECIQSHSLIKNANKIMPVCSPSIRRIKQYHANTKNISGACKRQQISLQQHEYYGAGDTKQWKNSQHDCRTQIRKYSTACGHYWDEKDNKQQYERQLTDRSPSHLVQARNQKRQRNFNGDQRSKILNPQNMRNQANRQKSSHRHRSVSENNININVFLPKRKQKASPAQRESSKIQYYVMHVESSKTRKFKNRPNKDIVIDLNYGVCGKIKSDKPKNKPVLRQKCIQNLNKLQSPCQHKRIRSCKSVSVYTSTSDLQRWANCNFPRKIQKQSQIITQNTLSSNNVLNSEQNINSAFKFKASNTCLSEEALIEQVQYLRALTLKLYQDRHKDQSKRTPENSQPYYSHKIEQ